MSTSTSETSLGATLFKIQSSSAHIVTTLKKITEDKAMAQVPHRNVNYTLTSSRNKSGHRNYMDIINSMIHVLLYPFMQSPKKMILSFPNISYKKDNLS